MFEALQNDWREGMINLIRDNLTHFDLFTQDESEYYSSGLKRLLTWYFPAFYVFKIQVFFYHA